MFCFLYKWTKRQNGKNLRTVVWSGRRARGEGVSVLAALLRYPDETSIKKTIRPNSNKQMTVEYLVVPLLLLL
jgi:hypothetical protein